MTLPIDKRQDRVDERRFVRLEQAYRFNALAAGEETTHLALRIPIGRVNGAEFWAEVLDVSNPTYGESARRMATRVIRKAAADKLREWRARSREREKRMLTAIQEKGSVHAQFSVFQMFVGGRGKNA